MSDQMNIEGKTYISSKRASESSSYTQDYVGQLARAGLIDARRVGGLWYVTQESLDLHKSQAEEYKPEPPQQGERHKDLDCFVGLDGKDYISAGRASEVSGYSKDYVGQLARNGSVLGRQVGNRWYVEKDSLLAHKHQKDQLLAAVQAQSVGLSTREAQSHTTEAEEFMNYISEESDLGPYMEPRNYNVPRSSNRQSPVHTQSSGAHMVPIRIIKTNTHGPTYADSQTRSSKRPTHSKIAPKMAILGAICTIVVLISLGFSSIRTQSLYTFGLPKDTSSLSALAGKILTLIGDKLETWVVRERVYERR